MNIATINIHIHPAESSFADSFCRNLLRSEDGEHEANGVTPGPAVSPDTGMSGAAHTPGPWEVLTDEPDSYCAIESNGLTVATIEGMDVYAVAAEDCYDYGPVTAANARLIAAAPELLKALTQMIDWDGGKRTAIDAMANARAIVAKATGAHP